MGEASLFNGFQARASALLNQKTFSDLDVHVQDGNTMRTFKAHKLFLGMSSRHFADKFYRNETGDSPRILKINNHEPHIVYMMLQFIYTDKTDLQNMDNLKKLFRLSKEFKVRDLENYCMSSFLKEPVTLETIFDKYEFALSENVSQILAICRNFVSEQTGAILKSPRFIRASAEVVMDILSRDILSVNSELQLLNSGIKWAKSESVRKNESMRICIYPLFQHLRFLSLTAAEFCDFVEQHTDVLNARESSVITRLLVQPGCDACLPSGFNKNTSPREFPDPSAAKNNASGVGDSSQLFGQKLVKLFQESVPKTNLQNKRPEIQNLTSEMKPWENPLKTTYKINNSKFTSAALARNHESSTSIENSTCSVNKTESISMFIKKPYSSIPISQNQQFVFSLVDMGKTPKSAFPTDIKCSIDIWLKKGSIKIFGIELKILNDSDSSETRTAYLTLGGIENYSHEFEEQIKNNTYTMTFPKPIKLLENNHVNMEIVVEDLVLNRCMGIDCNGKYILNCGLGINAEITLKSNQPDELFTGKFFHLIDKLLYKPC